MSAFENPAFFNRPLLLLRGEACGLLIVLVVAYAHFFAGHWLFFALLFLSPDVSLIAFAVGPTRAASAFYNLLHTSILPLALGAFAWHLHSAPAMRFSLVWLAHIAVDRALGYGLKYPGSFKSTHLQQTGPA